MAATEESDVTGGLAGDAEQVGERIRSLLFLVVVQLCCVACSGTLVSCAFSACQLANCAEKSSASYLGMVLAQLRPKLCASTLESYGSFYHSSSHKIKLCKRALVDGCSFVAPRTK